MGFLRNGSDEYYKLKEEADLIHRQHSDARTWDEQKKWEQAADDLVRAMHGKYGLDDEVANSIIEDNYLTRLR